MELASDKQDLKAAAGDAEQLLTAAASRGGGRIARIRARAEESLRTARTQALGGAREVNRQVREHPWPAIGIAAGIGLVAGLLLVRR